MGERWRSWQRNFTYINGVIGLNEKQKIARFSHQAGPKVQEIYENLIETSDTYDTVKEKLPNYFISTVNVAYERQNFRALYMIDSETVDQFALRLRTASKFCEFINQDEMIRDHIIEKC